MNYMHIDSASVSNGTGVRVVLWVSGCSLKCNGCQNPESWNPTAGKIFDNESMNVLIGHLNHPWIKGLTISGGHPLEAYNIDGVKMIIDDIRSRLPEKDIWLYTGLNISYNDIVNDKEVLSRCDVIVDGKYDESLKDLTLAFRGSKNQKIIDVKTSLINGRIEYLFC